MTERNHQSDHHTSRFAQAIVVALCAIPLIATMAFGAVDSWTIGLLSVLVAVVALLWLIDSGITGEFRYSPSNLQLPVIALIFIGCVQLLPLASRDAEGLLSAPLMQTLSMDPYATRYFMIRLVMC